MGFDGDHLGLVREVSAVGMGHKDDENDNPHGGEFLRAVKKEKHYLEQFGGFKERNNELGNVMSCQEVKIL